jgi:HAD superfamily hydrolase (TIGR01484 family)
MFPEVLVFDLDGTIARSKLPLDEEMAHLLQRTIDRGSVIVVISGAGYKQFRNQVLDTLEESWDKGFTYRRLRNLILLPLNGSEVYLFEGFPAKWERILSSDFSEKEKQQIFDAFEKALFQSGFKQSTKTYGELIEDRGGQITFSALGQQAPLELKKEYDPDHQKRLVIKKHLDVLLPDFEVRIGGTTSIDVNRKGRDKAYGLDLVLSNIIGPTYDQFLPKCLFVGDALFEGGNDESVKRLKIPCHQVETVSDTKELIQNLLDGKPI